MANKKLNVTILYLVIALIFVSSVIAVKEYKDAIAPDANNGHGNDRDHCDESNPSGKCPHKVSEPTLYVMIDEPRPIVCAGLYC
jgi:hypothetical protein